MTLSDVPMILVPILCGGALMMLWEWSARTARRAVDRQSADDEKLFVEFVQMCRANEMKRESRMYPDEVTWNKRRLDSVVSAWMDNPARCRVRLSKWKQEQSLKGKFIDADPPAREAYIKELEGEVLDLPKEKEPVDTGGYYARKGWPRVKGMSKTADQLIAEQAEGAPRPAHENCVDVTVIRTWDGKTHRVVFRCDHRHITYIGKNGKLCRCCGRRV